MKNNVQRNLFTVLVLTVIIILPGIAAAGPTTAAIDKVRYDFNMAFNAGNATSIDRLIDHDAIWLAPGEPAAIGRDKIIARYANYFQKMNSTLELKPGSIHICGKWAFLSSDFIRMDTPKSGGGTSQTTGHYLFVLKKQINGGWKIARDIWNEAAAPSKP